MDPFLSDRHARWHPVDLSLFPLRPPPYLNLVLYLLLQNNFSCFEIKCVIRTPLDPAEVGWPGGFFGPRTYSSNL